MQFPFLKAQAVKKGNHLIFALMVDVDPITPFSIIPHIVPYIRGQIMKF